MSKVLLIDNETTRVTPIRETLTRVGFETFVAADGNEALKTFLNEVPDLVLVGPLAADPEQNFCQQMRETRPGTTTPIILYCESLSGDALKQALERSGCNVYLEMPASEERLLEVCRHALVESVGSAPAGDITKEIPVEAPVFASPDAAVAELETRGLDIDQHLESMFETGTAPAAGEWTAEPSVPFQSDLPEAPVEEVAVEPSAEFSPEPSVPQAEETFEIVEPDAGPEQQSPDPDTELVGFQRDSVAFEQEGEVDPGSEPELASEARSLFEPSVDFEAVEDTADPEPALPYAPQYVESDQDASFDSPPPAAAYPEADPPAADSLDFSKEAVPRHDEGPPIELNPEIVQGNKMSGGWLWGVGAVALLVGGYALFLTFGPSLMEEPVASESVAAAPVAAAPIVGDTAWTAPTESSAGDPADPATNVTAAIPADGLTETTETTAPEDSPAIIVTSEVATGDTAEVANAPASMTTASEEFTPEEVEEIASAVADREAMNAAPTTTEPVVPTETVTPPAPTAAKAKPKPSSEFVFVPSKEVVDAATAGADFKPPRAINRTEPTYNAADIPAGGETVVLRALVNDWGKVVRVDVEQGRSTSPLVRAAVNAVLGTRYRPANDGGRPVRAWATETFVFE